MVLTTSMKMVMAYFPCRINDQDAAIYPGAPDNVTTMSTQTVTGTPIGIVMAMVKTVIKMVAPIAMTPIRQYFLVRSTFGMILIQL